MKNKFLFFLTFCFGALLGMGTTLGCVYYISTHDLYGARLLVFLKQSSQKQVINKAHSFFYQLPEGFVRDSGEDNIKKFGLDYIDGFHHLYDTRTGCEIRKVSRPLESVHNTYLNKTKTNSIVNTNRGVQLNYFLVDPLSTTQIMTTLLVPQNNVSTFVLTCGAGRAFHALYAHDFANFFNSFNFVQ